MSYYQKNKMIRLNYQKNYYQENKNRIKKYTKNYYEENKETLKTKRKLKKNCLTKTRSKTLTKMIMYIKEITLNFD